MIGVFGGTFDPVHFGHLRPALEVQQALGLEQVRFIPNRVPPHREQPWLTIEQRRELLDSALQEVPGFVLDARELEREGPSYMVDTLASLQQEFPAETLVLILGMDAFSGLHQWHQWSRILELCHLLVTTRPGYTWPEQAELKVLESQRVNDVAALEQSSNGLILLQYVTQLDISSSLIRKQLQSGRDVRYLLPDRVREKLLEMTKDYECR